MTGMHLMVDTSGQTVEVPTDIIWDNSALTEIEWHGMHIWASRSCGDCSNGPPCRCHSGVFVELLSNEHREAVEAYLRRVGRLHLMVDTSGQTVEMATKVFWDSPSAVPEAVPERHMHGINLVENATTHDVCTARRASWLADHQPVGC